MKRTISFLLFILLLLPLVALAQEPVTPGFSPMTQVFIRYDKVDWRTYEFFVESNNPDVPLVQYQWMINGRNDTNMPRFRKQFDEGIYRIAVSVSDVYGVTKYDAISLPIAFWSLHNTSFWWYVYAFVIILTMYYWGMKLLYLFNRDKVKRETRQFLDFLDTHGFVEHVVEGMVAKHTKNKNK